MEYQWVFLLAHLRVHHHVYNMKHREDPMLVYQVGRQDSGDGNGVVL